MADLSLLPRVEPPLASYAPVSPISDLGPNWIDAETVEALEAAVLNGLVLPDDAVHLVEVTPMEVLVSLFTQHLQASPITSPYPLPHRVVALAQAITELSTLTQAGLDPVTRRPAKVSVPSNMLVAASALEGTLDAAKVSLAGLFPELSEEAIASIANPLYMFTETQLVEATGITRSLLAQWRLHGKGPWFVKVGPRGASVRYPLASTIAWLRSLPLEGGEV